MTVLRQFFRFARTHRIVLVDPTRGLTSERTQGLHRPDPAARSAARPVPPVDHRPDRPPPRGAARASWRCCTAPPASKCGCSAADDIDPVNRTVRLGRRPHPVPLDPASWSALQRCLAHRQSQRTENPHVVVTRGTKAGKQPASTAYFSHLLDPAGVPPRTVRCTRLAALVNTIDPKLVAAAFGMDPEGVMFYLADRVDDARLPATASKRRTRDVSAAPRIGSGEHVRFPEDHVAGHDQAGPFVPGRDQLEEQVRRFGFERDVADFVDDEQRVAAEPDQFVLQPAGVVRGGEPVDPLRRGREQHPVPGLAGPDASPMARCVLPVPGGPRKTTFSLAVDEVQGAQVRDHVPFQAPGVVEVELLQRLAAGNRAARIRPSPPWDSRAATSRCRQAARNSSCVQDSVRARSASRSTASRSVGAFNARVRKASSGVSPGAGAGLARPSGRPRRSSDTERWS